MKRLTVLGTPITPHRLINQIPDNSFCVSYYNKDKVNIDQIIEMIGESQMLLLDNGAFSYWRKNGEQPSELYWEGFINWAKEILNCCPQAVAISPDVIEGDEAENRALALDFSLRMPIDRIMPVWHLNESLDQLVDFIEMGHRYIAFGSTHEFGNQSSPRLHQRITEAFSVVEETTAYGSGYARPWVHMLRFQSIAHLYNFNSSDSTNIAMNQSRHKQQPNHLHHMVKRLKNKSESTTCHPALAPAVMAIKSRECEIRIAHEKLITKAFFDGLNIEPDIPFTVRTPNLNSPEPVLEQENFQLTG